MLVELTDRQRQVLDFIRESIDQRGVPPTVREIMARFGFTSLNSVACHFRYLEKKGYIKRDRNSARAIRLTPAAKRAGIPLVTLEAICPTERAVW